MMGKTTQFLIILWVCQAWVLPVFGEDRTFPAGSLIIPMDKLDQNSSSSSDGNGIFQAYGYVFELLNQGITVFWIVNPDKTANDQPDFSLAAGTAITVVRGDLVKPDGSPTLDYAGGPFVVDANIPEDITNALAIRDGVYPGQNSTDFGSVVIHQVDNDSFSAPIGQVLAAGPPKIGLLETTAENLEILTCYMAIAGIHESYYSSITPAELTTDLNPTDFFLLWIPHWDNPTAAQIQAVKTFMDGGGDVLVMCNAIDAFEDSDPIMVNSSLGRNGATHDNVYSDYKHFDITPSQIGDFLQFTPDAPDPLNLAQDLQDHTFSFRHAENYLNWAPATNIIAWDNYDDTLKGNFDPPTSFEDYGQAWAYYAHRKKDANPDKGDVYYLSGHSYASCLGSAAGTVYRMNFQMSACSKKNKTAFWDHPDSNIAMTIDYLIDSQPHTITFGPIWEDDYYYDPDFNVIPGGNGHAEDTYLEIYTLFGTGGIRTNYGPGCQGNGNPPGTDQLSGLFIKKKTDDIVVISRVYIDWDCGTGCNDDYHFQRLTVKVQDEQQCGTPYQGAGGGGHLYQSTGNSCDSSDDVNIIPNSFSVTGSGSGSGGGQIEDIAGLRYILNTLLPALGDGPEYGRSTPTVTDDGIYFGTFQFPSNLGHFRLWQGENSLTSAWDTADRMPDPSSRNIYTFLKGSKTDLTSGNAATILPYTNEDLTTPDVAAYIEAFRDQPLGGIEKSSAAIVGNNERTATHQSRAEVAYINTTFGLMESVNINGGVGIGGYIPSSLLSKLKFTGRYNSLRPILNSSPTVKDLFLPKSTGDYTARVWRTYLILALSPEYGFEVLDVTDPTQVTYKWGVTDEDKIGLVGRASIAKYRKRLNTGENVLGHAVVVSSTTTEDGNGLDVRAYDLEDGSLLWDAFQASYSDIVQNVAEAPPAVAIVDHVSDGFDDRIIAVDFMGRVWEIDLLTGKKPGEPNSSAEAVYTASSFNVLPIGASASLGSRDKAVIAGFGTGGVDWSPTDTFSSLKNHVAVVDLSNRDSNGNPITLFTVDIGRRKLYAPVVFAGGYLYFIAISGDLNSPDPTDNLVDVPELGDTELYMIDIEAMLTDTSYTPLTAKVTKTSSSVYIKDGQAHVGGLDAKVTRYGNKLDQTGLNLINFLLWRINY